MDAGTVAFLPTAVGKKRLREEQTRLRSLRLLLLMEQWSQGDASHSLPAAQAGCSGECHPTGRGTGAVLGADCFLCRVQGSAVSRQGSGLQGDYLLPQPLNSKVISCR